MQVLLADDHQMVREALIPFIERVADDIEVIQAGDLKTALALAKEATELGLVILDLAMPGMDVNGLNKMKKQHPEVPVVILSASLNRATIMRMISNGADGYIPKSQKGTTLINALRIVLSGEQYIPALVAVEEGQPDADPDSAGVSPLKRLTPQERETLTLLVNGLSNKEIARALNVSEIAVKKRLGKIYRKFGVSNRTQAVRIAMEYEMVF